MLATRATFEGGHGSAEEGVHSLRSSVRGPSLQPSMGGTAPTCHLRGRGGTTPSGLPRGESSPAHAWALRREWQPGQICNGNECPQRLFRSRGFPRVQRWRRGGCAPCWPAADPPLGVQPHLRGGRWRCGGGGADGGLRGGGRGARSGPPPHTRPSPPTGTVPPPCAPFLCRGRVGRPRGSFFSLHACPTGGAAVASAPLRPVAARQWH